MKARVIATPTPESKEGKHYAGGSATVVVARALICMGEAEYRGERIPVVHAFNATGLAPIAFAPKEGLAMINGTTVMTSVAALILPDASAVLRALLRAVAVATEAL